MTSLLLALLCTTIHFYCEPIRWLAYGRDHQSFFRLSHLFNITALLSYLLPLKLGLPIRIFALNKICNLKPDDIMARALVDGLLYYGAWSTAALLSLIHLGAYLPRAQLSTFATPMTLIIFLTFTILILVKISKTKLMRHTFIKRLLASTREAFHSSNCLYRCSTSLILDILSYGARHLFILNYLGFSLSFEQALIVSSISVTAGLLSFMPLGLGGYEIGLTFSLAIYGIPLGTAIQTAMINRALSIGAATILGLLAAHSLKLSLLSLRKTMLTSLNR